MNDRFTTRVLLHHATDDDYEKLHEEMEAEGFTRTIISSDGTEYHLPQAEYNKMGVFTGEAVREAAQRAARKTGKKKCNNSNTKYWALLDRTRRSGMRFFRWPAAYSPTILNPIF